MSEVPLARKRLDTGSHYIWAVIGPAGAVDFYVTCGGSPGDIAVHFPAPEGCRMVAACQLLPAGICDGSREMHLPGSSLYRRWVTAAGDDKVIWTQLEAFYANRLTAPGGAS
jgi:hypothetical protein